MKRRIFIFIFLLMIAAFPARADYFFGPGSTGTGSMTYPGIGIPYTADGASWGASFGVGTMTDGKTCTYATAGKTIACNTTPTVYQANLSLAAGTMTNGYYCTYTTAGTLLSCNTQYTVSSNLVFGSDAQYDIPIRGASAYGRLATSAGMQTFLGLGITVSGNDVTFPGSVITTVADGSRKLSVTANSVAPSPTATSFEIYPDSDSIWKFNQNGTEYASVLSPTGGQVTFAGPSYRHPPRCSHYGCQNRCRTDLYRS
jgi:hypothetical protein